MICRSRGPQGFAGLPYLVCVRVVLYLPLAPDVSLASLIPQLYNLMCVRCVSVLLNFVVCFLRHESFPSRFSDLFTQDFSVSLHFFLYGLLFFRTRTHRTPMCSSRSLFMTFFSGLGTQTVRALFSFYYVDIKFFVGHDIIIKLLPTFHHFPRFCITFRFGHTVTRLRRLRSVRSASFSPVFFGVLFTLSFLVSVVSVRHGWSRS